MSPRDVQGILMLDKPKGITSNAALQMIKRLFRARKAGHGGSLDPIATGLLPIFFGAATKCSGFLLDADKHYQTTALLGIQTDTGDSEGNCIHERPVPAFSLLELEKVLAAFRGPLSQIPPMYSALKHQGEPLYKLARQGVVIERPARAIVIQELILQKYQAPHLNLEIRATKGTYIRTLVEDIGEALGCGAHVVELRRLGAGSYGEKDMISLGTLRETFEQSGVESLDRYLLPVD